MDLGIEVITEIFTKNTLKLIFNTAYNNNTILSENAKKIFALRSNYFNIIEDIISFLQGKNQTFARQICSLNYLPQASRFQQLEDMDWAFGNMGIQNKAKHLATLLIEDLSDFIIECIDENFGFSRYAEKIGLSAKTFDKISNKLQQETSFIDDISLKILDKKITEINPKIIGFSVPFPGNLFSTFRCAQFVKNNYPKIKIVMGGGFANTELRSISDLRIFDFLDYITLDDGELPIELIYQKLTNQDISLKRTFFRKNNEIIFENSSAKKDYSQKDVGTPDYSDLLLDKYISVIEIANPMHSLWSDGRWNKLTMAHGCYWAKCSFCDGSLDYIKRYEATTAKILVDKMEKIIAQTGETGFHFTDEAAPPTLLKSVSLEIIKRGLSVTWWTNIRFEKSFTLDFCILLKNAGCIAVSGGLEVASDRLLGLINKGVTVKQVAQVTNNLTQAGIMVHAYLMYGFPSQTMQETIDSLEMVRQMFELGIIQSGFWHQFALTAHSPVGKNPDKFGIVANDEINPFANNSIDFVDKTGINHEKFSFGLKKSLYNFMYGTCFDFPLQDWFDFKIPKTSIKSDYILRCVEEEEYQPEKPMNKIIWLGETPIYELKKSKKKEKIKIIFHSKLDIFEVTIDKETGLWLMKILEKLSHGKQTITYAELKSDFEKHFDDFEIFWYSKTIDTLRESELLLII